MPNERLICCLWWAISKICRTAWCWHDTTCCSKKDSTNPDWTPEVLQHALIPTCSWRILPPESNCCLIKVSSMVKRCRGMPSPLSQPHLDSSSHKIIDTNPFFLHCHQWKRIWSGSVCPSSFSKSCNMYSFSLGMKCWCDHPCQLQRVSHACCLKNQSWQNILSQANTSRYQWHQGTEGCNVDFLSLPNRGG